MQVVTKVRLYDSPFTIFLITEEEFALPYKDLYKSIGVNTGDCIETDIYNLIKGDFSKRPLKFTAPALFLQPFVKECMRSEVYRELVLSHMGQLSGQRTGVVYLKLILKPPDQEIIDYAWNDHMLRLVWSRVEIENAFSWLSTLGGAYSALGDYFDHCAEEAGRISLRQYKLSKALGDEGLAARSKLYSAIAHAQKGRLKLARHIVRSVHSFAIQTKDKRLVRMCQGVWAKLRYMKNIRNGNNLLKKTEGCSNGKVLNVK